MARRWRLYHPTLPGTSGATVELEAHESHHARRVLRLRAGDEVALFDGAGAVWSARVEPGADGPLRLRLASPLTDESEARLELVLFQGACRPERLDGVVQQATELGVAAIVVFGLERGGGLARLARWHRIAIESAKQCGRSRLPRLELAQELPPVDAPRAVGFLLDPTPGVAGLGAQCADRRRPATAVWIAVGPAGGLEGPEVERAVGNGWRRAGLGPRTLRADTAGIAAAAIVLDRAGELGPASEV